MPLLSKVFYLRLFILVCLSTCAFSLPTVARDSALPEVPENQEVPPPKDVETEKQPPIFNLPDRTKGKSMKSMSWKSKKPKEEKKEEVKETKDDATKENKETSETTAIEDLPEDQLTPDQKLWKKYRDLATGKRPEADEDKEEDKTASDETDEENKKESDTDSAKTEKQEKPSGLRHIVDAYKNSQKNKGNMNSRSFGSID